MPGRPDPVAGRLSWTIGEEIAREIFSIALRNERRSPGYLADPAWPWLRITALRLAGRWRRRIARELRSWLIPLGEKGAPPALTSEALDLTPALRQLPPRMRTCLVLAHLEDQGTGSIALMPHISTKAVEKHLHQSRKRLRTILGDSYPMN